MRNNLECITKNNGSNTIVKCGIKFNFLLLFFSFFMSIIFTYQCILAIENNFRYGIENMVNRMEYIADNTPLTSFSEEIVKSIRNNEYQNLYKSIMYPIYSNTDKKQNYKDDIIDNNNNNKITYYTNQHYVSTTKTVIQTSINNIRKYDLPKMSRFDILGVIIGRLPYNYINNITNSLSQIITHDIVNVFTRIIINAVEAGTKRVWIYGKSSNILITSVKILFSYFGYNIIIPISDKTKEKAFETFKLTITRSLNQITDLLYETTTDMSDNIVNNVYCYSIFIFASLLLSIMQIYIIFLHYYRKYFVNNVNLQSYIHYIPN